MQHTGAYTIAYLAEIVLAFYNALPLNAIYICPPLQNAVHLLHVVC